MAEFFAEYGLFLLKTLTIVIAIIAVMAAGAAAQRELEPTPEERRQLMPVQTAYPLEQVLDAACARPELSHLDWREHSVGVFGEVCEYSHMVQDGDRVEIYRPLQMDAKSARRKRAAELLDLYAARKARPGYSFPADTPLQRALEDSFLFDETPDQVTAVADAKSDMEGPEPMDRLVCGDVGFGKTEVAIRAAFKAVDAGKQVAVLCPTTLLAQQHGETFAERFRDFPVRVEVLSRFRTPAEQKDILKRTAEGGIDVLVGTHRLLSRDVNFKDLGLLVVDEEQRFGVRHKERIKELKRQVDVMTLSATPIPRTLYLALMGARDMSLINTPPRDRLPIHTELCTYSDEVLTEGADRVLQWRSPLYAYKNYSKDLMLLLKHYKLSDDIAFRFGDSAWDEYPLTAEKFARWVHGHSGAGDVINLFMDYETFGEHQPADTDSEKPQRRNFLHHKHDRADKHQGSTKARHQREWCVVHKFQTAILLPGNRLNTPSRITGRILPLPERFFKFHSAPG